MSVRSYVQLLPHCPLYLCALGRNFDPMVHYALLPWLDLSGNGYSFKLFSRNTLNFWWNVTVSIDGSFVLIWNIYGTKIFVLISYFCAPLYTSEINILYNYVSLSLGIFVSVSMVHFKCGLQCFDCISQASFRLRPRQVTYHPLKHYALLWLFFL